MTKEGDGVQGLNARGITAIGSITIGNINVAIEEVFKGPIIIDDQVIPQISFVHKL